MIFDNLFPDDLLQGGKNYWGPHYFGTSSSGENITEETAKALASYFACLRVVSEDVAKVPIGVYSKKSGLRTEVTSGNVLQDLLSSRLCPIRDNQSFRETVTQHAASWGTGYAEIRRSSGGGRPSLWIIHPSRVKPFIMDDRLYHKVSVDDISKREEIGSDYVIVEDSNMLRINGFGGDGITGFSVLHYGSDCIGLGLSAQRYGASFFKNTGKPVGVLEHPESLDDKTVSRLRESWHELYSGSENVGKVPILEEGMKFHPITIPPEEAQFLETRNFQVEEICRWFRVSPSKIQHNQSVPFANLEELNRAHVQDTLMPWLVRWETELRDKLVPDYERSYIIVEHDTASYLRGDTASQAEVDVKYTNGGILKINEVRAVRGYNPVEGGDMPVMQQGMTTLKAIAEGANLKSENPPRPPGQPGRPANSSLRPVLLDAVNRMMQREANAFQRAEKKHGPSDLAEWHKDFFAPFRGPTSAAWSEAIKPFCLAGGDDDGSARLRDMVTAHLSARSCQNFEWETPAKFVSHYYGDDDGNASD